MYMLREIERRDLVAINQWRNNETLISQLGAPFRYINAEVDNAWFDSYLANRSNTVRCAITGEDNSIIGMISLVKIDPLHQCAELHIMIGQASNQNKGIGTFAVMKMLEHAFLNMNLNRIELSVLTSNHRAIHLYQKCGFVLEGTKRQARFKQGKFQDLYSFAILREEYLSNYNKQKDA